MAIVNRDKDASEQKEVFVWTSSPASGISYGLGLGVGVTVMAAGPMPFPYILQSISAVATGNSGGPQLVPLIVRPAVGGVTTIPVSISNMVIPNAASMSTSSLNYSGLAPTGSTLLLGQRGDILVFATAVANSAVNTLVVNMVVKKTQDILSMNGVSS
jgi:hypothetical protein